MRVLDAKYVRDYKVKLHLYDGKKLIKKTVDLKKFFFSSNNSAVKKYRNKRLFKKVDFDFDYLKWGNEELDICVDTIL